tara:strand:+ start:159 stop:875 length:717 start_codon:yes stop_codon:yes gene_type:complete
MVNIDTVYQKVLALANKEQRGYITPQDFNLFANQAQLEIFEQYFYDLNLARKSQGNDTVVADIDDIIEAKLGIFEETPTLAVVASYPNASGGGKQLPEEVYRVLRIGLKQGDQCELLNARDFIDNKTNPLTRPSIARPIANISGRALKCNNGGSTDVIPYTLTYLKSPNRVNWTYVVINRKAMYNATNTTQHFELHQSEEIQLVNKILKLAGISTQQADIMRAGQGMEVTTNQQQPKI